MHIISLFLISSINLYCIANYDVTILVVSNLLILCVNLGLGTVNIYQQNCR